MAVLIQRTFPAGLEANPPRGLASQYAKPPPAPSTGRWDSSYLGDLYRFRGLGSVTHKILVLRHQPRVANDVGREDRGELAFHPRPAWFRPQVSCRRALASAWSRGDEGRKSGGEAPAESSWSQPRFGILASTVVACNSLLGRRASRRTRRQSRARRGLRDPRSPGTCNMRGLPGEASVGFTCPYRDRQSRSCRGPRDLDELCVDSMR